MPGSALGTQPVVMLQDAAGLPVTAWVLFGATGIVASFSASTAEAALPSSLHGTTVATFGIDGSALWTDLRIDAAGRCFHLQFTGIGSTVMTALTTTSSAFDVPLGPPTVLVAAKQPLNESVGHPFISQVPLVCTHVGLLKPLAFCVQ